MEIRTEDLREAYETLPIDGVCQLFGVTKYRLYKLLKARHIYTKKQKRNTDKLLKGVKTDLSKSLSKYIGRYNITDETLNSIRKDLAAVFGPVNIGCAQQGDKVEINFV